VEITEVRIKLMDDPTDRLQGFCSVTIEGCFVIRDLKIILGTKGAFVAMPSRKLTDHCPKCCSKNHLRAVYCNQCAAELEEDRAITDHDGRAKLYADIAHPINSGCRDLIQSRVLTAFEKEKIRAKQPNYKCTYDDYGEDRVAKLKHDDEFEAPAKGRFIRIDEPSTAGSPPHQADLPDSVSAEDDDEGFGEGFGEGVVIG
jgi:stage V sporulation protein G